jgi:diguanylate cyclase (GGDEF)-like protein
MSPSSAPTRVLFVDDEPIVRKAFDMTMRHRGLSVDLAASPAEAMEMAKAAPYDVIVTDMRMPGMTGYALVEALLPWCQETAFIIVSGLVDLDIAVDPAVDEAIASVIPKPWDNDELAAAIVSADANRRRTAEPVDPLLGVEGEAPGRVLLVEHDPTDVRRFERMLREHDRDGRVDTVGRLSAALEAVHANDYALVLTELTLPDARGVDAIARLSAAAPGAALVVLSSVEDERLALRALETGAQDYLVKGRASRAEVRRCLRFAARRKAAERALTARAHHDALTGLANRASFRDRLKNALARSRRRREAFGLFFIDLDGFKQVNDTLGHDAGDDLLREVAHRLSEAVRESDTVARLGGDEFAVLLEGPVTSDAMVELGGRVLRAIREPIHLEDGVAEVSASIGGARYPASGDNVDELLRRADEAMYEAKRSGKDSVVLHATASRQRAQKVAGHDPFVAALGAGGFELHFQPQCSLRDGRVLGLEALLRWRRRDGEVVPPADFLPELERRGLLEEAGRWALSTACEQLRRWFDEGAGVLRVAVNLATCQLEPSLPAFVKDVLAAHDLPGDALELEVHEEALLHSGDEVRSVLDALKRLGVRVVLDDFGSGVSSLTALCRHPLDAIKLDRAFVKAIGDASADRLAVGIVALARALGLDVIAEGVETREQLLQLERAGCQAAQGFFLGRPTQRWSPKETVVRATA